EKEVRYPHQCSSYRPPQSVRSHKYHPFHKRLSFQPHHTFERTSIHQWERIEQEANKSQPKMCTHSNLGRFPAGQPGDDRINSRPQEEADDPIHGKMGMSHGKVGKMPDQVGCPESFSRSLKRSCKVKYDPC